MEVILIQDVDNLGGANELVKVRNGYARNFLIPQKLAVEANPSNRKQLDEKVKQLRKKEEKLLADLNVVIAKLKEATIPAIRCFTGAYAAKTMHIYEYLTGRFYR